MPMWSLNFARFEVSWHQLQLLLKDNCFDSLGFCACQNNADRMEANHRHETQYTFFVVVDTQSSLHSLQLLNTDVGVPDMIFLNEV